MSELQLSLLILGALVIGGVYLFNRVQERRYRTQAEEVFRRDHPDVLLVEREGAQAAAPGGGGEGDVSAIVRVKRAPSEPIEPSLWLDPPRPSAPLDARIHHIVTLRAQDAAPIAVAQLSQAVSHFEFRGKPVRWQGRNLGDGAWEDIDFAGNGAYRQVQAGVQLANRGGPLSDSEMESFAGMLKNVAAQLGLQADLGDQAGALRRAAELDEFCAQVDAVMDFHVVGRDGAPIPATKVRALAESEGLTLRPDGVFVARNEHGEDVFTLANAEQRPFVADNIRAITTHGVVFSLDVPRAKDAVKVLSRMLTTAQQFAHGVGGVVVDERRREVKDTEIQQIRNQLQDIVNTMSKYQIPAGSTLALQLFAE